MAGESRAPKVGQMSRTRSRVLTAVTSLLGSGGFASLTIEAVVADSGVARSTIYRHWDCLGDLVLDAVAEVLGPVADPPDTGNVREDLIVLFEGWLTGLVSGPWGKLVPALVEASVQNDVFRRVLEEGVVERREPARVVLRRAIERGELPPATDQTRVLDSVVGPIYYRMLMSGRPIDEPGLVVYLIDAALSATRFEVPDDTDDAAEAARVGLGPREA